MDAFLGEIRPFAFGFEPRGWVQCKGQLLPISQNTALYSLLGTIYGGDGRTSFALPNIAGYVVTGCGQQPGRGSYTEGQIGGVSQVTLTLSEMPAHNHTFNGASSPTTPATRMQNAPSGNSYVSNVYAKPNPDAPNAVLGRGYDPTTPGLTPLSPMAIGMAGQGVPHNNMAPYLVINYCIALQGEFPQRP